MVTIVLTVTIGVAGALLQAYLKARSEVLALREALVTEISRRVSAEEMARQLTAEVARTTKAAESYRAEVEPLKALADGLGKQLAAMGRKK